MRRTVLIVGTLLLGIGAVVAQQDQLKQTQAVMKGNGKNAGALAAMVKGEKPYDQAAVDAALAQFEDTVKKFPTLFPDSIKGMDLTGTTTHRPKSGKTGPASTNMSQASPRRWRTPRARSPTWIR